MRAKHRLRRDGEGLGRNDRVLKRDGVEWIGKRRSPKRPWEHSCAVTDVGDLLAWSADVPVLTDSALFLFCLIFSII